MVITLFYVALIGSLVYGFDKVNEVLLQDIPAKTKFTVIVPFRNEAKQLPFLLASIIELNYPKDKFEFTDDVFGVLVQYPNSDGEIIDYKELVKNAHEKEIKVAVAADVESAHPEAVPPVTTPYVTAPFPDPPVVAKLGPAVYALPE